MPITTHVDFRKYPILVKRFEEGRQEGIKETLRLALKRRFGRIPSSVTKRVAARSDDQAQELLLQIVDGKDLKDLFDEAHR